MFWTPAIVVTHIFTVLILTSKSEPSFILAVISMNCRGPNPQSKIMLGKLVISQFDSDLALKDHLAECCLPVRTGDCESGLLGTVPGSATDLLCHYGQFNIFGLQWTSL